MGSILPPDPVTLFWKRWVAGVGIAGTMLGYGLFSLATRHSHLLWMAGRAGGSVGQVEVFGTQALWTGLAWLGGGIALFFWGFAPEHERLAYIQEAGLALGLLAMATGQCVAAFGALFGFF